MDQSTMHDHEHNEASVIPSPASSGLTGIFSGASPKLTFIMGLLVGVAGVSLIGFVLAASFAFSGKGTKVAVTNTGTPTPTAAAPSQPTAPTPVNIAVKSTDYVRGSSEAPLTIVTYTDLECPYCKSFHPSMQRIMNEYSGQVRWIYRHFPLSFHVNAQKEAEAAECVGKLGGSEAYWNFIDKIFERTTSNGTGFALTDLYPLAKEVGVAEGRFRTCLDQGEMTSKVQADLQEGTSYGVQGTPTSFINGTPVEGAVPYEQLKAVVDQVLAQ
ncbi:MAG TPA: hypothetical protein DDW92_02940 [Candidatus Veblenbacteria bacterium]|nr:hypothetical protein [Candidatus Veblenbacteria bacterium]HBH17191.1 hypothetical protein [Candidatus Veblenbacteria bacterium]HBT92446.1 hypothetical protein [Candidatus Veblenbacteria bacterium]HBZ36806.1 hypothetical protein [Candidatus Veblenbacteria bacterium]HCX38722.1 hypothetical protein [Candidatus Veblenbacteria bacterium]